MNRTGFVPIMVALLITGALIAGAGIWYYKVNVEHSVPKSIPQQQQAVSNTPQPIPPPTFQVADSATSTDNLGPLGCYDSDAGDSDNGMYTPGFVRYRDWNGSIKEIYDRCEYNRRVFEGSCDPKLGTLPITSRNIVSPPISVYECPAGCANGACVRPDAGFHATYQAAVSSTLVFFSDDKFANYSVDFALTGVALGELTAAPYMQKPEGGYYNVGDTLHVIQLYFKVHNGGVDTCIEVPVQRILNEEGDLEPSTTPFYPRRPLSAGLGCIFNHDTTYYDQSAAFVVDKGDQEFYFKSKTTPNVVFSVRLTSDGKLQVENVSQQKNG